ncbi:hypothetical protein ACFPOI_34020 [Nonomuraea angiospora]|uniref:AMP-binding enzyme C-terminal domain-containing protein n=1 Tax=Nonomuraea angiospora TaxID=46172 RepID=A0ABR9LU20_9ACTN|nr:hypothetical protein [Nonomuraea angiospora]MBE1583860.1 hypothetical protein [Nonomuraea angiospora]
MTESGLEQRLPGHPAVTECVVVEGEQVIAYVVVGETGRLTKFLTELVPRRRLPDVVAVVPALPRTPEGEIDVAALPLPVAEGPRPEGGKGGGAAAGSGSLVVGGTLLFGFLAFATTNVFWPYSTDLSGVPLPWAALFFGLYLFECLSFGLGVMVLLRGRSALARRGRSASLTTAAWLALAWLLLAWWPQDNFYRLAAKTDWPQQAALVYAFNVTLMIAAAVLVAFVSGRRR